jgi:hypothetical protein
MGDPAMSVIVRVVLLVWVVFVPSVASAQLWSGLLDSSRAIDWTRAGIPSGIPHRTTRCGSVISAYTGTAATINNAINACPPGQYVELGAGTFNLSTGIGFHGKSNVTLRGAGAKQTIINFTRGSNCTGLTANVCFDATVDNWEGNPQNLKTWSAGFSKGTTKITLGNTTNLNVGDLLVLDQLDDTNTDTGNIWICQNENVCSQQGASAGRPKRIQQQIVKITAKNANEVTITPGLHMPNWRIGQSPAAWGTTPVAMSGIEDLSLNHTSSNEYAGILMFNALNCWVKNVRSINSNRSHVDIWIGSGIVVRDSYFYGTKNAVSQSYGIESYQATASLIENNIFVHVTAPMMISTHSGGVYGYNYTLDNHYTLSPSWMIASAMVHEGGVDNILLEGNDGASGFHCDNIHGTSHFGTSFRNAWLGWETGKTDRTIPVELQSGCRYYNIVGNVLGRDGTHTNYEKAVSGGSGTADSSVYVMGYSAEGGDPYPGLRNDSFVLGTLMRWGNYESATDMTRWQSSEVPSDLLVYGNPVPGSQTLPNSLYLSSKPAWFGSVAWPPIGPDVSGGAAHASGKAHKIPARVCYEGLALDPAFASSSPRIRVFTPSTCYASAEGSPPAPSNLTIR